MTDLDLKQWLKKWKISQRRLALAIGMEPDKMNKSIQGTRQFKPDELAMIDSLIEIVEARGSRPSDSFFRTFRRRFAPDLESGVLRRPKIPSSDSQSRVDPHPQPSRASTLLWPELPANMICLDEMNVSAMGGSGSIMDEHEEVKSQWMVPRDLISPVTDSPAARIKIITVTGDSMFPEYMAGMRVMVDTAHKQPSPPGVYVIWDGFSIVLKRLEYLHDDQSPKVRLISANPDYPDRVEPLAAVSINGRVIGKWTWT